MRFLRQGEAPETVSLADLSGVKARIWKRAQPGSGTIAGLLLLLRSAIFVERS